MVAVQSRIACSLKYALRGKYSFDFTCERLLRDLVPEDMLDVFMADSSLWKNAFLEGKLCERLKSSHSIFLKLIGDTNEALKELQSRLKLDGEWKVRH